MLNKKIIFGIVGGFLVVFIVVLFVLYKNTNSTPQGNVPASYAVTLTVTKGVITSVYSSANKSENLNEVQTQKYLISAFNGPQDILWLSCPDGYSLSQPSTTTNTAYNLDSAVGLSMDIAKEIESVRVQCSKNK